MIEGGVAGVGPRWIQSEFVRNFNINIQDGRDIS